VDAMGGLPVRVRKIKCGEFKDEILDLYYIE
jgi:hypothetical protein